MRGQCRRSFEAAISEQWHDLRKEFQHLLFNTSASLAPESEIKNCSPPNVCRQYKLVATAHIRRPVTYSAEYAGCYGLLRYRLTNYVYSTSLTSLRSERTARTEGSAAALLIAFTVYTTNSYKYDLVPSEIIYFVLKDRFSCEHFALFSLPIRH